MWRFNVVLWCSNAFRSFEFDAIRREDPVLCNSIRRMESILSKRLDARMNWIELDMCIDSLIKRLSLRESL